MQKQIPTLLSNHNTYEHHKLICKYANKYSRSLHIPFAELYQEGAVGIEIAKQHFDPSRGVSFVTYAKPWLVNLMLRYFNNLHHIIREPIYIHQQRIRKTCTITKPIVRSIHKQYMDEEEDFDSSVDKTIPNIEILLQEKQLKEQIEDYIRHASMRNYYILRCRYWHNKTYREIGEGLGITREAVRQILQEQILPRIKARLIRCGYHR